MQRKTFRFLIAVCAIWAALSLPGVAAVGYATFVSGDQRAFDFSISTLGIALLPVAVIGLWHEQLWGFIRLLVGLVCVLAVFPTATYLHVVCLLVTLVRYFYPRNDAFTEVGQVTHE
jgi:hypothetical protein